MTEHEANIRLVENLNIQLDSILKYYFEHFNKKSHLENNGNMFIQSFILETGISWPEFYSLKSRLMEDGYFEDFEIFGSTENTYIGLTDKGKMFWNNGLGGYANRHRKTKRNKAFDLIHKWSLYAATLISLVVAIFAVTQTNHTEAKLYKQGQLLDTLQKQVYQLTPHISKHP